uniref:(northern house mosquito) hypothetical protein n=1 Tax=Culex pipiens TaxID=7175 RepID=A0A8D8FN62_CULPI
MAAHTLFTEHFSLFSHCPARVATLPSTQCSASVANRDHCRHFALPAANPTSSGALSRALLEPPHNRVTFTLFGPRETPSGISDFRTLHSSRHTGILRFRRTYR